MFIPRRHRPLVSIEIPRELEFAMNEEIFDITALTDAELDDIVGGATVITSCVD